MVQRKGVLMINTGRKRIFIWRHEAEPISHIYLNSKCLGSFVEPLRLYKIKKTYLISSRRWRDVFIGQLVLGGDGGTDQSGAIVVPSLCLGSNSSPADDRRLQRQRLCPPSPRQVQSARPLPPGKLHLLLPPQNAKIFLQSGKFFFSFFMSAKR